MLAVRVTRHHVNVVASYPKHCLSASSGRSALRFCCLPQFLLSIPQACKQAPTIVRVSRWMMWWDLTQPAYLTYTPCIKADRVLLTVVPV